MSVNCMLLSGVFASDQMLQALNSRAFGLERAAIVKEVSGSVTNIDPLNGIHIWEIQKEHLQSVAPYTLYLSLID